jgi:F-box-like
MQASMFSDVIAQIESSFNHSEDDIHDPDARIAAISTVDKEIDATRQFLRSLLTRRNSLVPISVLPPEILARVFHLLVLEEPPFTGRQNLGWIRVTHVCRHWRQVALDDSSLWAKIWGIPTNTKWISEMLARAKNAPLDVEFNAITRPSREALLMIPPHLSHTRHLRFHNLSTRHHDSVRGIYSCEAPALEHFELTFTAYSPIIFQDLGGNMPFKGYSPRLRTFSLTQVVIPWSLVPRGQLTQLKIVCHDEDAGPPGDLNQFIDLLVNCPSLEILALESCLPSQLTEFSHGRTIHLLYLSSLRLCGSTSRITSMLKMLKPPSSTRLHLNCISKTAHNDSDCLLLPVISAQFQRPASIEFKSLTINIRRLMTSSLNITASTFPPTLRDRQSQNFEVDVGGNAELVLSFDRLSRPGHSTDLLKQACKVLPISNLEFISMSATNIIDINWFELFGCCTNVTTMQAIGQGTSGFVRALTAPTVTNAGLSKEGKKRKQGSGESTVVQPASIVAHAHAAIFPELKLLGLTELNFSEGKHTSGILFDVFERGLQQRMAASGAPLKLLRISNCDISTEHASDLRKLVQDFHWDEGEGLIDGFECFDAYEQHLYDTGDIVSHGTALHDWDSDGYDDYPGMDYDYPDRDYDYDEW